MASLHKLPLQMRAEEATIRRFLASTVADHIHLVAIQPRKNGACIGKWFGNDVEGAVAWALRQNAAGSGVYWSPNVVEAGLNKKAKKRDMVAARFVQADIDPPKDGSAWDRTVALAHLEGASVPPSFIIDSGNGFQAFWRLREAEDLQKVEAVNKQLIVQFEADRCTWNIDRVMRLPGTVNFPNETKQARGYSAALTSIVKEDEGESVELGQLVATLPSLKGKERDKQARASHGGNKVALLTADDLGLEPLSLVRSAIEEPVGLDRSGDLLRCAGDMARAGFTREQMLGIVLNPRNAVSAHCLDQNNPRRAALRAIDKACGDADRPIIDIAAGELHKMTTQAEMALVQAGAPLYVRGGCLVRPIVDIVRGAKGQEVKVPRLGFVTAETIRDHLSRVVAWRRFDGRSKKDKPADPPKDVAATLLARDGEWKLRPLAGVLTTATLRPDGTILSQPGYDAETRLLLLDPLALPPIADRPSREDAEEALALLAGLLTGFPFVDDASASVALSMLLTPVVRGAMTVSPMHVATAPDAGTGKSYLVDLASVISSGERAPVIAAGRTEEETEKRLGAAMFAGYPIISIDNVNGDLKGDALCQLIERPVVAVRMLGLSKLVKLESRATIFATGNNIQLVEDMTRRAVLCSLDPDVERPELRQFAFDPLQQVLADRGKFVAAALTVVRAYIVAGCPNALPPLASFEDWSLLVRSPLVWLGRTDPLETMKRVRESDPTKLRLAALLFAWYAAIGDKALLTSEIIDAAEAEAMGVSEPALQRILADIAAPRVGHGTDARRLGSFLSRNKNKIAENLKLEGEYDAHAKQQRWRVVRVAAGTDTNGHYDLS